MICAILCAQQEKLFYNREREKENNNDNNNNSNKGFFKCQHTEHRWYISTCILRMRSYTVIEI